MTAILSKHRAFAATAAVTVVSLFALTQQAGAAPSKVKSPFLSYNAAKHTATLRLTAGLTAVNHTLNFNGYTNGGMVVSIPKGYTVKVVFTNKSASSHSAVFTGIADKASAGTHSLAFPGASSPGAAVGTASNGTVKFSFKVTKVGTYAIICEVGHHADAGMWAVLKVTAKKTPSIKLSQVASASTPAATATTYAK